MLLELNRTYEPQNNQILAAKGKLSKMIKNELLEN